MKKYTVIYTAIIPSGSGYGYLPQLKYIKKKKGETFASACEKCEIDPGSIYFILHGWSELVPGELI